MKVGDMVRGTFLEDDPDHSEYGTVTAIQGRVIGIHNDLPGGPYITVDDGTIVWLCDPHEIVEVLV